MRTGIRLPLIVVLEVALGVSLLVCVFAQLVVIPSALQAQAQFDPVVARAQGPLTFIGIGGVLCIEAVLIATAVLLVHTWTERIFSRQSFLWVDVIIGACLVAAGLSIYATFADLTVPELPAGTFPVDADDATSNSLLIFGAAAAGISVMAALVVGVLRDLLKRAVCTRQELEEVI